MFSRLFELSRFIKTTKSTTLLKMRYFSKGKSNTSKNDSKFDPVKLRNAKQKRGKQDSNNKRSEDNNTVDTTSDLPLYYGAITCLLLYSGTIIFGDINKIRKLKQLTLSEFEKEYLLNGEVKGIYIPGISTMLIGNVKCIIKLHQDTDRGFEEATIGDVQVVSLLELIRNSEKKLGVPRDEAIPISMSFADTPLFIVLVLLQLIAIKKMYPKWPIIPTISFSGKKTNLKTRVMVQKEDAKKKFRVKEKEPEFPNPMDIFTNILNPPDSEHGDKLRVKSDIKFKDVAGLHEAKVEVKEFLNYLKNPDKFIKLGAKLPRGAILLGPPGCGKTLLIKALANESDVPFIYKAGSEFVNMIGGVGAKKLRQMFADARRKAPAIIFIDEIDSIGRKRSQSENRADNDADQTLNQLLVEMDGMDSNAGIVVFAATNRADILDKALIRPGRFDRHILIDFPVLEERKEIFLLYLSKHKDKLDANITELKDKLAQKTPGMTGADIANVCNEAALTAVKLDYSMITEDCFDQALERIIAGAAKKNNILNEHERKVLAYHEAGHALLSWLLKNASPVLRVSIVSRNGDTLAFTQHSSLEKYMMTADVLMDKITVCLGGRAAQSIIFNQVSTADTRDLEKVKNIAYAMIREYGMNDKIGHLSFEITDQHVKYGSYPYSEKTRAIMDSEANLMISTAFKRAETVLRNNIDKLELIAKELFEKEILKNTDITRLIGPSVHDQT